jgi:hypothetical protein
MTTERAETTPTPWSRLYAAEIERIVALAEEFSGDRYTEPSRSVLAMAIAMLLDRIAREQGGGGGE